MVLLRGDHKLKRAGHHVNARQQGAIHELRPARGLPFSSGLRNYHQTFIANIIGKIPQNLSEKLRKSNRHNATNIPVYVIISLR